MQEITRREFLNYGVAAAGSILAASSASGQDVPTPPDVDAISKLRARFAGRVLCPGDAAYEALNLTNLKGSANWPRPALVAQCSSADEVQRCVEVCVDRKLPFAVRGGGHSYAGWGTCDGGIVIDLSPMKEIVIDPATRTARVGAGVLGGELADRAGQFDLVPIVGQCPSVCLSGLSLGGGLGFLAGLHGATCDNLLAAQLVSPDRGLVATDARQSPELFWAIRGGGGNFGVATSFTFQLHPAPPVEFGRIVFPMSAARAVLKGVNEVMAEAPDGIQADIILRKSKDTAQASVLVVTSEDTAAARACVKSLRTIAKPVEDTIGPATYAASSALYGGRTPWKFGLLKGAYLERFYVEAAELAVELIEMSPGPYAAIGIAHYMHGAVCRVPKEATAFELRDKGAMHLWFYAGWDDPAHERRQTAWIQKIWGDLQPYTGGRAYANYPGADDGKDSRAVYRANYSRLVSVKSLYDRNNLLRHNYNVLPKA